MRRACADLPFKAGDKNFSVTVSIGVSHWAAGDRCDDLLKKADVALYSAKSEGRNRVRAANEKLLMAAEAAGVVRYQHRAS